MRKIAQATRSTDIDEIQKIYVDIFSHGIALNTYLSIKQIADLFFNRSLNYFDIATRLGDMRNYGEALGTIRTAQSDMRNAEIRYSSEEDIQATHRWMHIYQQVRASYRKCLPDLVDDYQQTIEIKFKKPKLSESDFFSARKIVGDLKSIMPGEDVALSDDADDEVSSSVSQGSFNSI